MLSFNPAWSLVFDLCVCAAVLWLGHTLSRRRPFSALGVPVLLGAALLLCGLALYFGKRVSLVTSLIVVPWLAVNAYNDTEQPLTKRRRLFLTGVRTAVFVLIIACLLRPRLVFEDVIEQTACAVVLADVSTSMEGKDCPPEPTRYEALKAVLTENAGAIREIRRTCDYRFATFAEGFRRTEELPDKPTGSRTNLADAFVETMRDLSSAPTAGIVLLSDGRNNQNADAVRAARLLGVPVFAVCLGEAKGSPDFADSSIQTVDSPERVFVKNVAVVTVRVAYDGPETGQRVKVKLTAFDKTDSDTPAQVLGPKVIPMPGPGKTEDVAFEYMPQAEGIKRLVATVTEADKDANLRNNTREVFVRASKSALKVRFIEGEVRWEYKFLRRAIASAANIELLCVNAFLARPADTAQLLPGDEKEWAELSLVVLGDIPADRFAPQQLERLRTFVAEGGALLTIGGFSTLGPGGYGSTPVGRVLPVDVKRDDQQTLEPLRVIPTEDGLEHNILAFGPAAETKKIWASLPPLSGYTRVSGVKPAARVLVKTPKGDPILVVQDYEKGRTAVFAADTTWRWIFNKGKFARYHKAFWRQLVQWLTKSGYGGVGGGIWCETDRLRYLTGDVPVLTVRAHGQKVERARIAAVIQGPAMKMSMPIGEGAGQYVLSLPEPVKKSGEYEATVTARLPAPADSKKPRQLEARTRFVVQEIDIENENPGADRELLDRICKATQGGLFGRKNAHEAFDKILEILETGVGAKIPRRTYKRLWDNAFMYVALAGLLCAEWIGRKRKGLA